MRSSLVCSVILVMGLAAAACENGSLAGPDAQAAFSRALTQTSVVPPDRIVYLNDVRVPAGERLDHIDPRTITRVEVVKGATAVRLYGDSARAGVIRIYTGPASGGASDR